MRTTGPVVPLKHIRIYKSHSADRTGGKSPLPIAKLAAQATSWGWLCLLMELTRNEIIVLVHGYAFSYKSLDAVPSPAYSLVPLSHTPLLSRLRDRLSFRF